MRKNFLFAGVMMLAVSLANFFCKPDKPSLSNPLQQVIPSGFPLPAYQFSDNPLTKEGFELGRKLFYDGRLSIDGNYPCASCHQQVAVFGTYEHDRSHGYNDSHTLRNAPPLFNLAWQKELHWDGEYKSLFSEAVHPITTRTEMAGNFQQIIQRLYADATYRQMFRKAFGSSLVSKDRILAALAQFTGSITSYNSKYDKVKRGEALFTLPEQNGYFIYQQKCAACHPEPLFTDYSYRNIGLPVDNELKDFGRMRITGRAEDSLKFKVPSLRNVNMTANYMHDGRFNTLMQVLNHYSSGIQNSTTLDPLLVNRIPMTTTEKTELVSFLKTLSDSTMLTDIRYKKPD